MHAILWFLAFAIIFYLLMRAGGWGGHGHAGQAGNSTRRLDHAGYGTADGWVTKDPVCGMEGPVGRAPVRTEHAGTVYYFCSTRCRDLFLQDPDRYIRVH